MVNKQKCLVRNKLTITFGDKSKDIGVGMVAGICANYNLSVCATYKESFEYMNQQ